MNLQESIRRILKEETENSGKTKIEKAVKKMIKFLTKDIEFPDNFLDFMVDIRKDDIFGEILLITTVMKKPFSEEAIDELYEIRKKFMPQINAFFGSQVDRVSHNGTSTYDVYIREKNNQIPNF